MAELKPTDVFVPTDYPTHTYVSREDQHFEESLDEGLATPGMLVSVLGPSKTGKTQLINKVVGTKAVLISGSTINSPEDIWRAIFRALEIPFETQQSRGHSNLKGASAKIKGDVKVPFVAGGGIEGTGKLEAVNSRTTTVSLETDGLIAAVKAMNDQGRVLVLDDFHYIDDGVKRRVAQQLKEAISQKLKVVALAVPHRGEDPIRQNPDLRGRVISIDTSNWRLEDLSEIGTKGFPLLGLEIEEDELLWLAQESLGSPQLMQALCLYTCRLIASRTEFVDQGRIRLGDLGKDEVARRTSNIANARTTFQMLKAGPKTKGKERKTFPLSAGGRGDVYEVLLRAIAIDPPSLSFNHREITDRINRVVVGAGPGATSWSNALGNLQKIINRAEPPDRVIDWEDDGDRKTLTIVDPYFLFYLRWKAWAT